MNNGDGRTTTQATSLASLEPVLRDGELDAARLGAQVAADDFDIDWLLAVLAHPAVSASFENDALGADVQEVVSDALARAARRLGIGAYGALPNLRERISTRLQAERRKHDLVREHLARRAEEPARQVELLRNYLGTAPAPLFVDTLSKNWPALLAQARDELERGVDLAVLLEDAVLIDQLREPDHADFADILGRIGERVSALNSQVTGGPEMVDALLRRALTTGAAEAKLMAAALAAADTRIDLVADILALFLAAGPHSPQLAIMAAHLDPLVTRNALAQFLVDVAHQNPEEPEANLTPERMETIVSTRCVLPLIGSPLEEMTADEFPDTPDFADLRRIPPLVNQCWALWEFVRANHPR